MNLFPCPRHNNRLCFCRHGLTCRNSLWKTLTSSHDDKLCCSDSYDHGIKYFILANLVSNRSPPPFFKISSNCTSRGSIYTTSANTQILATKYSTLMVSFHIGPNCLLSDSRQPNQSNSNQTDNAKDCNCSTLLPLQKPLQRYICILPRFAKVQSRTKEYTS